jgi:protein TonB
MFEQAMLSGGPPSARLWSTCAGITGQMFLVGTMLLVPLIFHSSLPDLRNAVTIAPPGPPPPPPPPPGKTTVVPKMIHATRVCTLCTPVSIPDRVRIVIDDPPAFDAADGVQGGVPGGVANGVPHSLLTSILDGARWTPPPPPPPVRITQTPPQPPAPPEVVRATPGGQVQLGAPIYRVEPPYPQLARTAHIEGVVVLEALVGVDGRVKELRVIKPGHVFLVKAAMDAVRQWIYAPTTLNGKPVEVISPITVTFRLGR